MRRKIQIPCLKNWTVLLAVLFSPFLRAQVKEGSEMVMLNPASGVHEIHINSHVATSIIFPEPVSMLTGYGLVEDIGAVSGMAQSRVCVVHYDNVLSDTLVVRLLRDGEPCHATVRAGKNIHLIRFVSDAEAHMAVIIPPPGLRNTAREVTPPEVAQKRITYNSDELVGMLGKARQRKFLQSVNPALYTGWQERNGLELNTAKDGVTCTIYEIQRWPEKDVLVFRCWLNNTGSTAYEFDPVDVRVRADERAYPAQLVDCSGIVRPNEKIAMDVVLQGGPGGGREHLSIDNDFRIDLPQAGRTRASAALFGGATATLDDGK